MQFDYYEIRPCVNRGGYIDSFLGDGTPAGALAEAEATGLPVFWTLYGVHGTSTAIGDFDSFETAYRCMQAILLPMRAACDRHYDDELDDICNQSTTEERL